MFKFKTPEIFKRKDKSLPKREGADDKQLLKIVGDLEQSPEVFRFLLHKLAEASGETQESIKKWFINVSDSNTALGLARKVDGFLGAGTFRKLSFISAGADAEKNVLRILNRDLRASSFEGQAEKGLYLNIKENYGVEWGLEKASRYILQNFFDGNGQTLDGINILIQVVGEGDKQVASVKINGRQEYDWRELVHLGGSTKTESNVTAGGFGEGTKILALVLLRDHGATRIVFSSGDWEVEFYLDQVPEGSYRNKEDRGLFVKKRKKKEESGNTFEVDFTGPQSKVRAETIQNSRNLFYNNENPDFKNPSFDNKQTGGFNILPNLSDLSYADRSKQQKGNLYIAGQRINYDSRDQWNNIDAINIWTWKKVTVKDRDRGMMTSSELNNEVIQLIVDSMSVEDCKKSVREFEDWYTEMGWTFQPNYKLLEAIVLRLEKEKIKMEFKPEFLANNIPFSANWITQALKQKGYKMCPFFMGKIGMITSMDQFKKLQEHYRVPETSQEKRKIEILKEVMVFMGFPDEDSKDVWVFSAVDENNIFHGQYKPDFFWMARENLAQGFTDALYTYVHEAAHKAGPHGNAQFEYTWNNMQKMNSWRHQNREVYEKIERAWSSL